jgi:uncharacterized protein YkwD
MRKRLVVVGAAASALLLAGGIAATTAGAQETPDVPGLPGFSMPSLFGWGDSDYAADAGDSDNAGDVDDAGDYDYDDDRDARDRDPVAADAADGVGDGSDVGPDAGSGDDSGTADKPGTLPTRHRSAERPRPTPAREKPAHDDGADRPAHDTLGFSQRAAGGSLTAAAREDVTAADVSDSPSARFQQQILALVNQNRQRGGCDGLSVDRRLIEAANEHAADMARHRYFAHESPDGDGAGDRVRDAGYRWKRYGENIARGADSPYEVVDGWMHSPEHRENIMDCRLDQMGVGLAIAGDHTPYWVQDFATPMT